MRPPVPWFGGKFYLWPQITTLAPPCHTYVEPFGGGGSVLLNRAPAAVEIYNDLNSEIVTLFRLIRDHPEDLARAARLTPYSREEYETAATDPVVPGDEIETGRRLLVKLKMAYGGGGQRARGHGWGYDITETAFGMAKSVSAWVTTPDLILAVADRFRRVQIEHRPALEVLAAYDTPQTLFYADPPYLHETRPSGRRYAYEMSREDHEQLLDALTGLKGMVLLSGHPSQLYESRLIGWERHEFNVALNAGPRRTMRTEVVWLNPAAAERRSRQMTLAGEG